MTDALQDLTLIMASIATAAGVVSALHWLLAMTVTAV